MLCDIQEVDRSEALVLLRWLAYAKQPLTLCELADATIIDRNDKGLVDLSNRGRWKDTLEILAGLVVIDEKVFTDHSVTPVRKDTKVRLAHFTVKEYLESEQILASEVKMFHLSPPREHGIICQSCLIYLTHYSDCAGKTATKEDLSTFPLLEYAASSWSHHSSLKCRGNVSKETALLLSKTSKRNWLLAYRPDFPWLKSFHQVADVGSSLYYASASTFTAGSGDRQLCDC